MWLAASSQAWEVNNLQRDCCDLYRTAVGEGGANHHSGARVAASDFSENRQRPIYIVVFPLLKLDALSDEAAAPLWAGEGYKGEGERLQRGRGEGDEDMESQAGTSLY